MSEQLSPSVEINSLPSKNSLEANLRVAISKLGAYLETPREQMLREHQSDVMQSLYEAFNRGETAGYISLPTGSGKSVLIAEIVKVLGLKTIIGSPTRQILEQNALRVQEFAPDVDLTNYYTDSKDLSGKILNTTYRSLQTLVGQGMIKPEEIGLLLLDESDMTLGEQRHQIFRQFPNALMLGLTATPYFSALEGYKARGIVRENERWVQLFNNCIHEMNLEEAMERGILSGLDIFLFKSNARVGNVSISKGGEYNDVEINRYLNRLARNYLTIGMIAGLDKIPGSIQLSVEQREEIKRIHERIKGRRTAIFGLGIDHVVTLALMLRESQITAEAIHSKVDGDKRREILKAHTNGDIQVVLGVDMLARGWDSPATEVGVFLAPRQSGTVAVQELGRILRPQPGKDRAVAIQLVDQYQNRSQAPILIPNLFDPYYVLRGTQTGKEHGKSLITGGLKADPAITFRGMDLEVLTEQARSDELVQSRFKQATISEINQALDQVILQIQEEFPNIGSFRFYQQIADRLPRHVLFGVQEASLQAIASIDSNTAALGRQSLVYLNMKSILSAIESFVGDDEEENDEIIQSAITAVLAKFSGSDLRLEVAQQVYLAAESGASAYIANRENMPVSWVRDINLYKSLQEVLTGEFVVEGQRILSDSEIDLLINELNEQYGVSETNLKDYILYRNRLRRLTIGDFDQVREKYSLESIVMSTLFYEDINGVLGTFEESEQNVIKLRYGLFDGRIRTYREIGNELNLSRSRVQQIELKLREDLSKNREMRLLKPYLESEYEAEDKPEAKKVFVQNDLVADRGMFNELGLEQPLVDKLNWYGVNKISRVVIASIEDMTKWGLSEEEIKDLMLKTIIKVGHGPLWSQVHWVLSSRVTDEYLLRTPARRSTDLRGLSGIESNVLNARFGHNHKIIDMSLPKEVKEVERIAREKLYRQIVINMEMKYHELVTSA